MQIKFEKNEVVIRIPAGAKEIKDASASKSGKSKMVATTNGFSQIEGAPNGMKVSLNLIVPNK